MTQGSPMVTAVQLVDETTVTPVSGCTASSDLNEGAGGDKIWYENSEKFEGNWREFKKMGRGERGTEL